MLGMRPINDYGCHYWKPGANCTRLRLTPIIEKGDRSNLGFNKEMDLDDETYP